MNDFDRQVESSAGGSLRAAGISIIQANVGLKCNLACVHCHVASSPVRKEEMTWEVMTEILRVAGEAGIGLLDVTGGAPEMNPHFRRFVEAARALRIAVQVRTNLTIMLDPGYEDLPEFFARNDVRLVASLPCYEPEAVDTQRGEGVYDGSIEVIRRLNSQGYGRSTGLPLHLVYNPQGPHLPPAQDELDRDFKRVLFDRHGILFTGLIAISNMPIGRYLGQLKRDKQAESYRALLGAAFNADTLESLMCRHQIEVDWNGTLYDCDFNLALRTPVERGIPANIRDFDASVHTRRIATGNHCFGCTAGSGSSCAGALV